MVSVETSAEGEQLGRQGEGPGLPPHHHAWAHPWSVPTISPPARPETPVPPSGPQEGQPESVETTSSQEAVGGRHGAPSAEQQPIYFR